jgi:transposase-like protein
VAEQRYEAVRAVIADGETVTEVAARFGVSRKTVHVWLSRYEAGGLEGLTDRSHRPRSCPHQMLAEVEVGLLVEERPKGASRNHATPVHKTPCEVSRRTLRALLNQPGEKVRALPNQPGDDEQATAKTVTSAIRCPGRPTAERLHSPRLVQERTHPHPRLVEERTHPRPRLVEERPKGASRNHAAPVHKNALRGFETDAAHPPQPAEGDKCAGSSTSQWK